MNAGFPNTELSEQEMAQRWRHARSEAKRIARNDLINMVVGWQMNDHSGEREPGYCPAAACDIRGPFVQEVTEVWLAGGKLGFRKAVQS